jgi:uncharacterized protein (TIGR02001 family)
MGAELRTDLGILIMANIRGFLCAASGAAIASLAMSTAVLADDEAAKFGYSLTMSATSDYIFRGISSNDQDPAFQPYLEFTYGIGYLGFWGSNVAAPANPFELDIVAGLRPVTGPVTWDIGVLWYTYPDSDIASDLDYVEFKVGGSVTPMTNLSLSLTGYVTPDQANYVETETIEGTVSYTLPNFSAGATVFTPSISGLVGYSNADRNDFFLGQADNYTYWNAGLKLAVDKYFMDFRYWDTNIDNTLSDSRFVFSAGVTLP